MKISPYTVLFLLMAFSCKSAKLESEHVKINTKTNYYENGFVKSVGNLDSELLLRGKIGLWNEFYENGKLKESGIYKSDFYTDCCTGGLCDMVYSYKVGEWNYYHKNGKLKAKGIYGIGKKNIETSCEGGDEIRFGYITENWKFYDLNGNEIRPTNKQISEIEKSSYSTEWELRQ